MIFKILKSIVTLALLYYLYIEIPWYELKIIISSISIDKFILSIFVQVLAFILLVLRWSVFFRNLKHKINLFKIFKYGYIGIMFNNILPSSIGGDFVRGFYITKNGVPMYKAVVTLLLDRFIGLYVVLLTSSYVFFHYRWKYASLDTVEEIIYLSTLLLTLLMIVFLYEQGCTPYLKMSFIKSWLV